LNFYQRWRIKRDISRLDHEDASQMMRFLAYNGADSPIVLWLAERALATAPERHRHSFTIWVRMLRAGRRVKVSTFPINTETDVDPELEKAVEDAFAGWDYL
jgi:hypothetical protein